jgi:drug/metabolite transporter (DMT)-like permease
MTGTLLSFSIMAVSIRALAGALSILEILSVRAAVGLAIVGALLASERAPASRAGVLAHVLRNTIRWLAILAMSRRSAARHRVRARIHNASLDMRWRVRWANATASRVGAVVLGLLGVIVILRPGIETLQPAALLVLTAALGYAPDHCHQASHDDREPVRHRSG